jgi:hypothetical protein
VLGKVASGLAIGEKVYTKHLIKRKKMMQPNIPQQHKSHFTQAANNYNPQL